MGKENLGIITLEGSKELTNKVDSYLQEWRRPEKSFIIPSECPRFGTGESKGIIKESVRGKDIYILVDVCNYSITYNVFGCKNHMSPDDHYQDLKRIIAACGGHAERIHVIMPFLYEGRQHKRGSRESLDCALALQELGSMGISSVLTFDAHDPRVQNATPLNAVENIRPTYQFVKTLFKVVNDLTLDSSHMMIVSPDEGAMERSIYLAGVLEVDTGMFYKRRDYSKVIDGRNPIVAHEFLGNNVEGKDIIVIDDMISSGESMLDVCTQLKRRKANRIYVMTTFGLFTNGLDQFDEAYEDGLINGVFTSNLIYQTSELLSKPWYYSVDMSEYIAAIIDSLNNDYSISELINPSKRIKQAANEYRKK